jgi:hypothetical protein
MPARAAAPERLVQSGDMDPQRAFVDDPVGPFPGDELLSGERLAGALDKRDKYLEGAAAEAQRLLVIEQHPLRREQPERSKDESLAILHGGTVLKYFGIQTDPGKFGNAKDRRARQQLKFGPS